ncbi:FG-GAP-like repeat-containing protein [Streptomyces sp. NPDC090045]|uniref:FG-GAP-like repeat-containing protein n=1 Tax=Streptomyces sp. NPDC090045 TaxID=3365927 RepID=UPI003810564D
MADPVNTASGTVTESVTDVSVPGKGLLFALTRSYRSDATATDGLLGKGWTLPFESKLSIASDKATLADADGAQVVFTKNGDGSFAAPKPVRFTLAAVAGGYTLTALDGTSRTFDSAGRLTGLRDSDGRGLKLTYAGSRLAHIVDAAGRTAAFIVDSASGRLSQVNLADGRKVNYTFADGQLASVASDSGVTKYSYVAGRLATIVDANGNTITQNTYDAASGRIAEQIDAAGKKYTFTWTPEVNAPAGSGQSDMKDPTGGIWTDVYEAGVLVRHYDPLGHGSGRGYDQKLNVIASKDANFRTTEATYDARGNVSSVTLAGVTEKWEFDATDRLKSHTDGRNSATTYEYDGASTRIAAVRAPNGKTGYTYTGDGKPATVTTPDGRVSTYEYDSTGHLLSVTNATGDKTTYAYDSAGRLKSATDPRGNKTGADPAKFTTVYDYWPSGQVKTVTDVQGHVTAYTYDANGNTSTVTDALSRVTAYEYDVFNRVKKVTAPGGRITLTTYDDRGNTASVTDPTGAKTTYTYDAANRLASQTSPRGNVSGADAAKFTTTYGYDNNGNQTKSVDPTGAVTTTAYDVFNRPTTVTDALGQATTTEYDTGGNVAKSIDALGKATTYTYTPAGLQETVTNPLGKVTRYGYDSDGHRTSLITPTGAKSTWAFDTNGRLKSQTDPRGNVLGAEPSKFTTTYAYDPAGNQKSMTNPLGQATVTDYNALNQAVSVTNALGKATTTVYDELGRVQKVTAPDGGETTYTYKPAGDVATRKDPNGHTTTYDYDDAGRQTAVTDPLGHKQTVGFDKDGNPTTRTNARGVTATTTFDTRGLATDVTYSDGTPAVTEVFDAIGQRRSITDVTGTRTLDYDKAGRLTSVTPAKGKGALVYTYDDAGQLASRTLDPVAPVALNWTGAVQTVFGDLTGDGITDVIRTDDKSGIKTYLGRADKTFPTGSTRAGTGTGFRQVLTLEYTGDGKLDLLAIDKAGHLLRYDGDGKGAFAAPVDLGGGWDAMTLTAGDFNNDGKPDFLATSSADNHLYLYPGNGAGGYGERTDLGEGWGAYRIALLEFTGDAKLDILAINPADGHLYLYPGNGTGGFGTRTDLGAGWAAMSLFPGDFNNDSKPDFLAVDAGAHKLSFYPGTGTGTFGTPVLQTDDWTPYRDPAPVRFSTSGNSGIVAADNAAHLRLWEGDGKGTLTGAAIATSPPGGVKTNYGYNNDGQRSWETSANGSINYGYDQAGNLKTTTLPTGNGYAEKRTYDNAGRITAIASTKSTTILASWTQTLDAAGQPTRIDVTRTGKPASYQYYDYDPAGRLLTDCIAATKASTCPDRTTAATYTYDQAGNRKTHTKAGTTTNYTYDDADQLTQTVTGTTTRTFSHDDDGNQTADGADTFTYDANNRLTGVTSGGATYAYTYDADSNRTAASKNNAVQRTTAWDINNALPQAAADYNGSGSVTARYRYNPLGQIGDETTGGITYYTHHDLIGSVTDLTDSTGTLQTSYTYTAFGETTQANVATTPPASPFTYTGEYKEPTTNAAGLYLRARNYTPDTGRFTSRDPRSSGQGKPSESQYAYVGNSPTHLSDPAGTCGAIPGTGGVCVGSQFLAFQSSTGILAPESTSVGVALCPPGASTGSIWSATRAIGKRTPVGIAAGTAVGIWEGKSPLDAVLDAGGSKKVNPRGIADRYRCSSQSREQRYIYFPLMGGKPTGATALMCPRTDLKPPNSRDTATLPDPPGFPVGNNVGIDGKHIYDRAHIIADRFYGAPIPQNVFTGFQLMNISGMKTCENRMASALASNQPVAYGASLEYQNPGSSIPTAINMTASTPQGALFTVRVANVNVRGGGC